MSERRNNCCVPFSRLNQDSLVLVHTCEAAVNRVINSERNSGKSVAQFRTYYTQLVKQYLDLQKPIIHLPFSSCPSSSDWFTEFKTHPLWNETPGNGVYHKNEQQKIKLIEWMKQNNIRTTEVCGGWKFSCHNYFVQQILNHGITVRFKEAGIF